MSLNNLFKSLMLALALGLLALGNHAAAQAEPSLHQIYEAAQGGRLDDAQKMMAQVLQAHPNSAKAHFVHAELSARQGFMSQAREELATAERLAPGLPFAKPEAVQNLRSQVAPASFKPTTQVQAVATPPPAGSFPWGVVLLVGAGAVVVWLLVRRKVPAPMATPIAGYGAGNPLSGPQTMGMGNPMGGPAGPAMGQPGYAQPSSGMGSGIMGGLATGLAVGAGVMAAEAIGKRMMGGDRQDHSAAAATGQQPSLFEPIASNSDMGGQNFGVNDASSWDDGGGSVASNEGGGDWDS